MNLIISLHPIAFEYSYDCVVREMLLVIVKIWLRWRLFAKFYEILFKQYFCLYSAAADHPPPLLRRLWRQHREGVGRELNAAGRGAERSHELRDVSCVRLEREVLGVR